MIQTCTHDDILRYAYQETTADENQHIEEALAHDNELLLYYLDVVDLRMGMEKALLLPPDRITANILAYSRQYRAMNQTNLSADR